MPTFASPSLSLVGTSDDSLLADLVRRLSAGLCARVVVPGDPRFDTYAGRLRTCFAYHAERISKDGSVTLAQLAGRLERGELGTTTLKGNIPREVILAQALEQNEAKAASAFDVEFMPIVRAIARNMGGERAASAVENFAAELVLPREGRGPKIATFLGRTTLAQWLAPVVANTLRVEVRRRQPELLSVLPEPIPCCTDPARPMETRQCEELLRPIFIGSCRALEASDRLLLQLLVLDDVPQKDVARSLKLHTGTITRRRQHAAETLLGYAQRLAADCPQPRQAADCLQLVLAGDDPDLGRQLADVLADGVRATNPPGGRAPQ